MQSPTALYCHASNVALTRNDAEFAVPSHALSRINARYLRFLCPLLVLALLFALPLQATVASRYAYVLAPGTGEILEYSINPSSGALAPIAACPSTPDPNSPAAAVVDRMGNFLYVVNQTANSIWVYSINPANGCLITSPAPAVYQTLGLGPVSLDLGVHEEYMFISDGGSAQIDAFSMNNGTLRPISGSPFPGCANAAGIAVDEIGSFVYLASNVSSNGSDSGEGAVCNFPTEAQKASFPPPPPSLLEPSPPTSPLTLWASSSL